MIWFLLLIPIFTIVILQRIFPHKITITEMFIPIGSSALIILILTLIAKHSSNTDTDYRGALIIEVQYYEAYETWVEETCTRTYECGTDKQPQTCTETYDCSYCKKVSASYIAIDNIGRKFPIDRKTYQRLLKRWNNEVEVELNRDIDYHGGCGQDGDMFSSKWDGLPSTAEASVRTYSYTNRTQNNKSVFHFSKISEKDAEKLELYNYPPIYDVYRQISVLGLDSLKMKASGKNFIQRKFEYFNGYYGPRQRVKLFVLLFYNKSISVVNKQQSYWMGGNANELIVCIGINPNDATIDWVKSFSWCVDKKILIDIREDIMEQKDKIDFHHIYSSIESAIDKRFEPRDLDKEFEYIEIELSTSMTVLLVILVIVITGITSYWCIINEVKFTYL